MKRGFILVVLILGLTTLGFTYTLKVTIEEGQVIYKKTSDPNIVLQIRLNVQEIHLDKLNEQVSEMQGRIDSAPKPKLIPIDASNDIKEAIEHWNRFNVVEVDNIQEKLDVKETLLGKCNSAISD